MEIDKILSKADQSVLMSKMTREYSAGLTHVTSWRESVKDVAQDYLLPKVKDKKVQVNLVRNKLKIRLSTMVGDEIDVQAVSMNGRLGKENAANFNKVAKSYYKTANMRSKLISVYTDDGLKGVGCMGITGWNDHSQEPILSYCDTRAVIPDPKNWQDNNMRFFGMELSKHLIELESDDAYDQKRVEQTKFTVSEILRRNEQADDNVKGFNITMYQEGMIDIYNHITTFKAEGDEVAVWLTTWTANRSELVRAVKMRALTPLEMADASKIDFGVKFFRAEPIQGSFAGASLIDDVGAYQVVETYLTNLSIDQAAKAAFGGKTVVDARLGIDTDQLADAAPAGSVISTGNISDPTVSTASGIYQEPVVPVNQGTQAFIRYIDQLANEASGTSAITGGQSLPGDQTKAEIQTIQKNINAQFSFMASNYMESLTSLWESIYRSFAANMSSQRKKEIVIVDAGEVDSYGFRKNEFISKGDFYVVLTSKNQERIKQKQQFAVFFSIVTIMLGGLPPGSPKYNQLMRMLGDLAGVEGFNVEMIFPLSADERKAYDNLDQLNNDIELATKPQPGEDHNVYIQIYKTGLETPARDKAIEMREAILDSEPKQGPPAPEEAGDEGALGAGRGVGASLIASDEAKNSDIASLGDVV